MIVILLLSIWFLSSFGAGILFSDYLDNFQIGGFKLGFWFSQQGSIISFVFIIVLYCFLMNKLDKKYDSEGG
jgi:putative solute:sodium symporter small subunit